MRTILFGLLVVAFAVPCTAADKTALERPFTVNISKLLPNRWFVKEVAVNAVPYNHGIKEDQRRGTSIELVGPSIVKGPRGINDEPESFIIWIMPADYTPIRPRMEAQFAAARLLGSNETIAVYGTSFTTGTPTWKTWEQDIVGRLGLKSTRVLPAAQLIHIPEP